MLQSKPLKCSCGWEDPDYWWDTSPPLPNEAERADHHQEDYIPRTGTPVGENPPCPECGAQTETHIMHMRVGAVDDRMEGFGHEGRVITSRSEFKKIKAEIEARNPGKTVVVNQQSESEYRAARDAKRHALWQQRKKNGIDSAMVKQWDAAKKSGDPIARNNSLVDLAKGRQKSQPKLKDRARIESSGPAPTSK